MGPLTRGMDGALLEVLTAARFPSLPPGMKSSGNSDFTTPLKTSPFTSGGRQDCGNERSSLDDEAERPLMETCGQRAAESYIGCCKWCHFLVMVAQ